MRKPLLAAGQEAAHYEIRGIVKKGFEIEASGKTVYWENIGDPVQKGLHVPDWIRDIVANEVLQSASYAYCDSKGVKSTREYLAAKSTARGGSKVTPDDITFFNGLGDAIARVYGVLNPAARVLMPSPAYPAHSGAEINRIGSKPVSYSLHPENDWLPDPEEVRAVAAANPDVCALLIVNPDNPTGKVYPKHILESLVEVAGEFDLFIICDEIYENLVYRGRMTRLCEVIGDVPAIVMKGISKEIPWPGSRCGWLEYLNRDKDASFEAFCARIDHGKMTEVCSTTLPQRVIPSIMEHPGYTRWHESLNAGLAEKMNNVQKRFNNIPGFECCGGGGAFYSTVHASKEAMNSPVPFHNLSDDQLNLIRSWMKPGLNPDYKLVYYLLAVYGICVVPLSSFGTDYYGFRFTLLEQNNTRFNTFLDTLQEGLQMWTKSEKHPDLIVA